ncbi:Protein CBG20742 [Caenorhabditis briggsae]|uniref:Protein CBG20742 n=1 Tax=Caenorhabditis briggsae TaxID=6238 RepID=A8XYI1_CAEBR|nr:Protein CBG20742 [Caenorhabditis briggsae]CAP37698.2 Protein CBG20742 [Caenorhabditis briggsae]
MPKYRIVFLLLLVLLMNSEAADLLTCTSKEEPILVSGSINKAFSMQITDKVKNCNGYCVSKLVSLDATLADGTQAHIRNFHFSCIPIAPKAEQLCSKMCTTQIYKNEKSSKTIDRSVGSLKRVLIKEIGDFSFEKAEEKTCCCKDARCARRLDAMMRLNLHSNYKIH